jgi:transcriptional regulator GlxA family with amidase domain
VAAKSRPSSYSGDQAQYVDRLRGEATGDKLASLRQWMLENLSESMTIDALAAQAHMSRRSLVRHFRTETRTSPMAWLTKARIDRARELLENTAEPIEQIGRLAGLGSPASVRTIFHKRLGTSPTEYRKLFRQRDDASEVPELPSTA